MYMPNILGVFIFIFYVLFWLVIVLIYNIKKKKKNYIKYNIWILRNCFYQLHKMVLNCQ